jgi:ATP-dependent RNA helicase DeaD
MPLPTAKDVNAKRRQRFQETVQATIGNPQAVMFKEMINELITDKELDVVEVASALAHLAQNGIPLFLNENERARQPQREREDRGDRNERGDRPQRERAPRKSPGDVSTKAMPLKDSPDVDMVRFRMEVGYQDGVKPGNIVGAIANEADLESKFIGHIEIFDDFSMVDLPDGMPETVMSKLKATRICGQPLHLQVADGAKPVNRKPPSGRPAGGNRRPGNGDRRPGGRTGGGDRRPRRDS